MTGLTTRTIADAIGTVSTTALDLTAGTFGFTEAQLYEADEAFVDVQGNPVNYRTGTTAPTSTDGHALAAGDTVTIYGQDIPALQLIRSGASDATVVVTLRKIR